MNAKKIPPELEQKFTLLLNVVEQKDKQIAELQNRSTISDSGENGVISYFKLFQEFLTESSTHKWIIERKYATELSQNYVDIDFKRYRQFVDSKLDKQQHEEFRAFLLDMLLIDRATFEKERGIFAGSAKDRRRVIRIRTEVYKRLAAG